MTEVAPMDVIHMRPGERSFSSYDQRGRERQRNSSEERCSGS